MTICSYSKITLISENWSIKLILRLFKIFIMRAWQNESSKLFMISKEVEHDFLIFHCITGRIITQRFILEKFKLFNWIKVIAGLINKNLFIVLNISWTLWRASKISVNKEIIKWSFDNIIWDNSWYFFKWVESVYDME